MPGDRKARKEEERKEGGREGGKKEQLGLVHLRNGHVNNRRATGSRLHTGFGLVTSAPPACYSAARKKIPGEQGLCSTDLLVSAASNTGPYA